MKERTKPERIDADKFLPGPGTYRVYLWDFGNERWDPDLFAESPTIFGIRKAIRACREYGGDYSFLLVGPGLMPPKEIGSW